MNDVYLLVLVVVYDSMEMVVFGETTRLLCVV